MSTPEHYVSQLLAVLSAEPDRVAVRWRGVALTAGACAEMVSSAAGALRRAGTGPGGVVALCTVTNSPATLLARYAANLLGATVVYLHGVNAANPHDELPTRTRLEVLRRCGASVLIADSANLAWAREMDGIRLATWGVPGAGRTDLTGHSGAAAIAPIAGEIAVVTYTSGTTGRPKGVARNFGRLATVVSHARSTTAAQTFLVTTPLHHATAFGVDAALAAGGTVVLHEGFDAAAVLRAVDRYRVNRLYMAPAHLYELLDHPHLAAADLSSLRTLTYAGGPAAPGRLARAVEVFGQVLTQVYGTSEGWMISMLSPAEHADARLLTTVGKPMPYVQVGICDPEDRRELATGETGEIRVRSPIMMDGYWGEPELTARAIVDGWLHTGDVGYLDERGYLHLVDRIGDMIKTNGVRVFPADVEKALLACPGVAQAAVFGVSDGDSAEHIHAAVIAHADARLNPARLTDHVAAVLSPAHAPVRIDLRTELPMTDTGKPDKARLRADACGGTR